MIRWLRLHKLQKLEFLNLYQAPDPSISPPVYKFGAALIQLTIIYCNDDDRLIQWFCHIRLPVSPNEARKYLVMIFHKFLSIGHRDIEIHWFQFLEYNDRFQILRYVQFHLIPDLNLNWTVPFQIIKILSFPNFHFS